MALLSGGGKVEKYPLFPPPLLHKKKEKKKKKEKHLHRLCTSKCK